MNAIFRATIASPLLAGSYDPAQLDKRFYIRPASLKGLWRWWARAFVAGVLYERGCLHGVEGGGSVLKPTPDEAGAISRIVGIELGLGYAGEKEAMSSRFRLNVRVIRPPNSWYAGRGHSVRVDNRYVNLQRMNLLSLSGRVEYAVGGDFEISVDYSGTREVFNAGVGILATALTLSGIGKGSRKGLGSLDITKVAGFDARQIREIIESVRQALARIVRNCGNRSPRPPPLPALTNAQLNGAPLAEVYSVSLPLDHLHNFFLRSQRSKVTQRNYAANDLLRERLEAWVLGLPREQKGTGYTFDGDRRASTFMASYHTGRNIFGGTSFLTVLISGDWPSEIKWTGAGSQSIKLDDDKIIAAYKDALDEFKEYTAKLGGQIKRVWP
jgi:CRISPR-associated protein Cmr1